MTMTVMWIILAVGLLLAILNKTKILKYNNLGVTLFSITIVPFAIAGYIVLLIYNIAYYIFMEKSSTTNTILVFVQFLIGIPIFFLLIKMIFSIVKNPIDKDNYYFDSDYTEAVLKRTNIVAKYSFWVSVVLVVCSLALLVVMVKNYFDALTSSVALLVILTIVSFICPLFFFVLFMVAFSTFILYAVTFIPSLIVCTVGFFIYFMTVFMGISGVINASQTCEAVKKQRIKLIFFSFLPIVNLSVSKKALELYHGELNNLVQHDINRL